MLRGVALAAVVGIPIGCASAPMPPPHEVRVRIVSDDEPVRVRLTPDSASALQSPILRCTTRCDRPLWTGEYRLDVDGPNVSSLHRRVEIREPSWLIIRPGSATLRYSGLALEIVSVVALPVSFALGVTCSNGGGNCSGYGLTFLGALFLGLPVGWIMNAAGKTTFEIVPAQAPAPPTPLHAIREHAGSVAMDRGGLGWTWRF